MLAERAFAKLNFGLSIGVLQPNGLHLVDTVMQTISLADELLFEHHDELILENQGASILQAAGALRKAANCALGARIKLVKRIPLAAGLGGGSADAAATLRGLNKLWKLGLDTRQLCALAAELGSDTAFMLVGGRARVGGTGEVVTPLATDQKWHVVVIPKLTVPKQKTKTLFALLDKFGSSDGDNAFMDVAVRAYDGFDAFVCGLGELTGFKWRLSGAGPAVFSTFDSQAQAQFVWNLCREYHGSKTLLAQSQPACAI